MRYEERTARLKDGSALLLRAILPDDAGAMLVFLDQITCESPFMLRSPGEITLSLAQEEAHLQQVLDSPRDIYVGAVLGGVLVANLSVRAHGSRAKVRHRADLGLAVLQDHWSRGLGSILMEVGVAHARAQGFEQLELEVFSGNQRALALYQKFGFSAWGSTRQAFKLPDGSYQDDIKMGLFL